MVIYMKIHSNSILLAPANLHLPIYQQILKEKNNCINIQVLSLSTYIQSFIKKNVDSELTTLYKYRQILINLSFSNSYKDSIDDIQFLSSCLSFVRWMKLYSQTIQDLKEDTKKEKDLKEIISYIYDIPIFEDYTNQIIDSLTDCQNIYIVNKQMNKTETFWTNQLIQKGAHLLVENNSPEVFYYSVANNKKQAQLVSNLIIENNLNVDDIFVSCNNESEKQVLAQIFDLHKIPYTFLSQKTISPIPQEWIRCFYWIQKRDLSSFLNLVEALFKEDFDDFYQYYSKFPEQFETPIPHLENVIYQKNNLIDEYEFNHLKKLEEKISHWKEEHSNIFKWKCTDFKDIGDFIQSKHPTFVQEDQSAFSTINQYCTDAKPFIQKPEHLSILIQQIEKNSSSAKANELKGVLIGDKNEITSIRPILFLLGAHSKNYPSYSIESGLFDEMYLRNTHLPSLQERLDVQKNQIKTALLDHTHLFVLYPQSNYEGSSFTRSNELDAWIQKTKESDCQFIAIQDNSIHVKEEFYLSKEASNALFFTNNVFSISRLETFSKCPLQHFLKYGLHVYEPIEVSDVKTRGTILHAVLEKSTNTFKKEYVTLSHAQIYAFVEEEFDFYKKVYPSKKDWIQIQIEDYTTTIELIFSQLKFFEENWFMSFHESEHQFQKIIEWNNLQIELIGYVDRIDTSSTSFCIFDYKSTKKELETKKFQSGLSLQLLTYTLAYEEETDLLPVGCFYVNLKAPYITSPALKVKYNKKQEDHIIPIDRESDDEFIQQNCINGWSFNGIDVYQDNTIQVKIKRDRLNLKEVETQWPIIISGILNDMSQESVCPNHTAEACLYCEYERICRSARQEISKQSYIEKESQS